MPNHNTALVRAPRVDATPQPLLPGSCQKYQFPVSSTKPVKNQSTVLWRAGSKTWLTWHRWHQWLWWARHVGIARSIGTCFERQHTVTSSHIRLVTTRRGTWRCLKFAIELPPIGERIQLGACVPCSGRSSWLLHIVGAGQACPISSVLRRCIDAGAGAESHCQLPSPRRPQHGGEVVVQRCG